MQRREKRAVRTTRQRIERQAVSERAHNYNRCVSPAASSERQAPLKPSVDIQAAAAAMVATHAIASQITFASLEGLAAAVQSCQDEQCVPELDPEQSDSNGDSATEAEGAAYPPTPPPVPWESSAPLPIITSDTEFSCKQPRKGKRPTQSIRCTNRIWMHRQHASAHQCATVPLLVAGTSSLADAGDELADALFGDPIDALFIANFQSQPRLASKELPGPVPVVLERTRKRKGAPQRSLTP